MRNAYNALTTIPEFVKNLLTAAEKSGSWKTGIESDEGNRGSSINTAVYGHDETQGLAVVQVRQCIFHPRRYNEVRKDYYLLGRTEQDNFFAHPIESPCRAKVCREGSPEDVVAYVLAKIWDCTVAELGDIERQGDVAFVPVRSLPASAVLTDNCVTLRETHRLEAAEIYQAGDTLYVKRGARLKHTKRQHKTIRAREGLYRVQVGVRARVWGFTAPMGD